jgi:hypothetical protein
LRAYTSYGILPRVLTQDAVITIRISLVTIMIDLPVVVTVINKAPETEVPSSVSYGRLLYKPDFLKYRRSHRHGAA